MSYKQLVHSMEDDRQPGIGYNATIVALVFLAGIISAMILCQGCNTIVQGVNGAAKDMVIGATAVKLATDGGLRPANQPDSMILDHETMQSYLEGNAK